MEKEFKVLTISVSGSCSGEGFYKEMRSTTTGLYGVEENFGRVEIGGYIMDLRPVPNPVPAVIRGPLLGLSLKPDEVESLSDEDLSSSLFVQAVKSEPGNAFGQILHLEDACRKRGFSSLDKVGINVWLQYWRDHGARIGQQTPDGVVWE